MSEGRVMTLLVLAVVLVYANSLPGAFHYDDYHSLVHNPSVRDAGNLADFFVRSAHFSADADKGMYRPLVLVTYAANYALHGMDVAGYHVVNLLLHLACVLVLWRLVLCVEGPARSAAAAWAALLFGLHPLGSEPVNYISSRSESLAALFLLLSVWLALRRPPTAAAHAGSVLSFGASLLSKATGTATLALLACGPHGPGWRRRGWQRLWPYVLVLAAYLSILAFSGLLPTSRPEPVRSMGVQALTQAKAVAFYLHRLLMPVRLSVDPAFREGAAQQAAVWAGMALLASALVLIVSTRRGRRRWWLLWPLWVALPASVVPLNVLVNEHRVYLAGAGLFTALAVALTRRRMAPRALIAMSVCLAILTFQRNQVWATERSLWEDAVRAGPQAARSRVHLGKALRDAGDLGAARHQFEAALVIDPGHLPARSNLASILYERARSSSPPDTSLLRRSGREYEAVLQTDPRHREALTNLGNVYAALRQPARAQAFYERAITSHPNYADAYANLADLMMQAGEYGRAARLWSRVVALEPENGAAFRRLGDAHALGGRLPAAVEAYRRGCQLEPDEPASCYNLGETLLALAAGATPEAAAPLLAEAHTVFVAVERRFGAYRRTQERLHRWDGRQGP